MSFELLPDEIVAKIMGYLADDPKSLIHLASTCRRCYNLMDSIIFAPCWIERRPLTFNFYMDPKEYSKFSYDDQPACECIKPGDPFARLDVIRPTDAHLNRTSDCYNQRLNCWLNSKRRRFSTLKFRRSTLNNSNCLKNTFRITLNSSSQHLAELNIKYLVSLEIHDCCITVDWLDTLLIELPNVSHLVLSTINYRIPDYYVEGSESKAKRLLGKLQMNGLIPLRIYNYLLSQFPARELDLRGLSVQSRDILWESHRMIRITRPTHRYFGEPDYHVASISVLSVIPYLLNQQKFVKHLIADIEPEGLVKILQHDELKHLRVTVTNFTDESHKDWNKLNVQLSQDDLARLRQLIPPVLR